MEAAIQEIPVTITETLRQTVFDLHIARVEYDKLNAEIKAKREEMEAKFEKENLDLLARQTEVKTVMETREQLVREAALLAYQQDGEKQRGFGIGIRVITKYEYDDKIAFDWAKQHEICLTLDGKAFKDVCKADSTRPDFVQVTEEPSATIATDLSKALEAA